MKKLLILLIVVAIAVITCWLVYREGSLAVNKVNPTTKMFVIRPGESLSTIARNLSTEGLIRNKVVFYIIVKQMGIEKKIQAGDFRLSTSQNTAEIAKTLTHGTVDSWLQVVEGLRKEQIGELVSKKFPITETEFDAQAKEGYLFPDTYLIPSNASAQAIIDIMTNTFNQKYTADFDEKAKKLQLTKNQVVTLASIVEREGRSTAAKNQIASILLKRLQKDMPLQSDATVQYALGYQADTKEWWKKELTDADLKLDSPYNTYKNVGLPPGPICNPGLDSLQAVVNADPSTPYLFYITGSDNKMHYATTLEEHEANIQKYLK